MTIGLLLRETCCAVGLLYWSGLVCKKLISLGSLYEESVRCLSSALPGCTSRPLRSIWFSGHPCKVMQLASKFPFV